MTQNFRKTLMATTMLAGLAIFTPDAAQAGPNGGPSLGSISGFSSMRMDFNRIGGPGRALSRHETRIVPLDVVKTTEKPKDTKNVGKNISKKDTKVARVSNPKSVSGGKGKQDLGNTPDIHVPAAIADIFRLTGGNIGDVSGFGEWAKRLQLGPLVVANPLFPGNGEDSFPFPWPKTDQEPADRNFLDGWPGYSGAPSMFPDPTGKVSAEGRLLFVNFSIEVDVDDDGNWRASGSVRLDVPFVDFGPGASFEIKPDKDGNPTAEGDTHGAGEPIPVEPVPVGDTAGKGSGEEEEESEKPANEKDSQPAGEGYGRPSTQTGWCSPTGGCLRPANNNGSPRIIPAETDGGGTVSAHRQSPSWATDPNPDDLGGGGGRSERTGYTPQDEEDGDNDGPGNPELEGLNAAL